MRRASVLAGVLLAFGAGAASETEPGVFSLQERDTDGAISKLTTDETVVDINSTVLVGIDKSVLLKAGSAGATAQTKVLIEDLLALEQALTGAGAALATAKEALSAWATAPAGQRQALSLQLVNMTQAVLVYATADKHRQRFRDALNKALDDLPLGASVMSQYLLVGEVGNAELGRLRRELEEALKQEAVYAQVGAWVATSKGARPVHLPGFDAIPEGEFFEVDRWSLKGLALTPEQQEQLKLTQTLATSINDGEVGQLVRTGAPKLLAEVFKRTLSSVDEAKTAIAALEQTASVNAVEIRAMCEAARDSAKRLGDLVEVLRKKYSAGATAGTGADLLLQTSSDLQKLTEAAREFLQKLEAIRVAVDNLKGLTDQFKAQVLPTLTKVKTSLDGDLKDLNGQFSDWVQSLTGVVDVNTKVLAFSEMVSKLELKAIPTKTELDLRSTGRREAGDSVVFKARLGRGSAEPVEVDTRRLVMHRVLAHFETAVSLIFASEISNGKLVPVPGRNALFQAAASYSLLIKRGSRSSGLVNTLLRPGIGLNISAPDLNGDGLPDLGLAVTVSLFRDIVQVGGGYAVFANRPFFFFGVGLPLPTLSGLVGASATEATIP